MSHQVKIFVLDKSQFNLLLRGQALVRNLPADGDVVAASHHGGMMGFMVYSAGYPHPDPRRPLPVVQAVLERKLQ
jgi:hypothetical protein